MKIFGTLLEFQKCGRPTKKVPRLQVASTTDKEDSDDDDDDDAVEVEDDGESSSQLTVTAEAEKEQEPVRLPMKASLRSHPSQPLHHQKQPLTHFSGESSRPHSPPDPTPLYRRRGRSGSPSPPAVSHKPGQKKGGTAAGGAGGKRRAGRQQKGAGKAAKGPKKKKGKFDAKRNESPFHFPRKKFSNVEELKVLLFFNSCWDTC